ncbi:MFS general substrate transporter [Punctularia strigosozonata HHB-11173 SS5]|uniref:MFS general substrate transporter n=1 Tax=Punctularia strigosozonata (strain HHB-11173) TaxID=741275 RepID=UPI00044186B6|nr:MFS general substrate transporter [Punctularia strigosozonata HHB-11173 SS5]EIN13632.1 MFS general substrate transporter [Punctularia strigosozonata HHB-11173 SS5]
MTGSRALDIEAIVVTPTPSLGHGQKTGSSPPPAISGFTPASQRNSTSSVDGTLFYASGTAASSVTRVDEHDINYRTLSTTRILIAHIGAALSLFLATTDATIVSTSLPTIAKELNASQDQYTWVGISYMLTQTAFQPLYGRISDLVGRKAVLYTSMLIFALGSALCGSAQSISWLIAARALAGVGGGGIVSAVWVITAEIVAPAQRAKWSQALSITWSCSAIAGPLLGGLFSGNTPGSSWRWAFYINLPIGSAALLILSLSLRPLELRRAIDASWYTFCRRFDFVGLGLFMAGTICTVLGFGYTTIDRSSVTTICLISFGIASFVGGGLYETVTRREALFSPTAFKNSTAAIILVIAFLHQFAFNAGTFYLALYFQAVNGLMPVAAGLMIMPYSLGSSLISLPAAWFIGYWQKRSGNMAAQKWVITIGLVLSALGFGLMAALRVDSSRACQILFPLVSGLGLGLLFHAPYQVFTRVLGPEELASGTSAFFLVRFTGATVGLSVAGAIFSDRLAKNAPGGFIIPGANTPTAWTTLKTLEPVTFRTDVLTAVSSSLQAIWIVCAPCLAAACLISIFVRKLSIRSPDDCATAPQKRTPTSQGKENT